LNQVQSQKFNDLDKVQHFVGGEIISISAYEVCKYYDIPKKHSIIISISTAFTIGLLKELYDSRKGGTGFNVYDLGATTLGGVIITIKF
jgi:uncharacterized protein YfiM (DUF2279 family)